MSLALTPGWAVGLLLLIAVLVLVFVVLVDGGPRIGRGGLGSGGGYAVALLAALAPVPAPALTLFGAGLKSRCADVRGWASATGNPGTLTDGVQRVRVSLPCGFVPGAPGGTPRASMLSYRGESQPGSTEPAMTPAAPAGESRPSWGRGTEIGPRALASAPGEPQAVIPGAPIVPVERVADDFGRDLAWLGAGVSADLFSTSWALHRCRTCAEGNPFGVDGEARVALKVAMTSSSASICWWLRRHGHPRLATITRWSIFGVQAIAAAQNTVHAVRGR